MLAAGLYLLTDDLALVLGLAIGAVGLVSGLNLVLYLVLRRQMRASVPVGASITVRLDLPSLQISTPIASSTMQISAFDRVRVHRDVVVLRMRGTGLSSVLPRQVLSDHDLSRIRSTIDAANADSR